MIGKLLDHRYQVIRVLATGGFGETYIAQDTKRPGKPICVVKHLKPANSETKMFDTAKRLFQSEAETLEQLGSHDQIPRLLAYFDENQEFYLVQEYVEGHPLSDELLPCQRWSENQAIELLMEVLDILKFVHGQGVIHRDIKPDNIIRRASDKKLVLVDFGAVKQLRVSAGYPLQTQMFTVVGHPSPTVAIGTPGYMPTEQGQGKPRPNSDMYALGIIAIQALTGVAPIDLQEDPSTGEILWQHLVPVSDALEAVLSKWCVIISKTASKAHQKHCKHYSHFPQAIHLENIQILSATNQFSPHLPYLHSLDKKRSPLLLQIMSPNL